MATQHSAGGVNPQQLRELFQPLHADQRTRIPVTTKPEVIDLGSRRRDPQALRISDIGNTPTIVLFLTNKGSHALDSIRDAITSGHSPQKVQQEFSQQFAAAPREKPMQAVVQDVMNAPVYAEFRYAEYHLADHVHVPEGLKFFAYVFPYNGARLSRDGFSLIQWRRPNTDVELEALVVHNAPPQTDAERAAAGVVGTDRVVIHPERWCDTTWWVAATYAAAVAQVAAVAAAAGPTPESFDVADLGDEILRRFGDNPSLEELIGLRKSVLPK